MGVGPVLVDGSQVRRSRSSSSFTALAKSRSKQQLFVLTCEPSDPPNQLRPGLFIGSQLTEQDLAALQAAGVTAVLQVGVELVAHHRGQLSYLQLQCSDSDTQDMVGLFSQAFEFINEGRKHSEGRFGRGCSSG